MTSDAVLAHCYEWVESSGGIALIDMPGLWNPDMEIGREPWSTTLNEVVRHRIGERRRAGSGFYERSSRGQTELLRNSPFEEISSGSTSTTISWTLEEVVGYLYAISFANRNILGDRAAAFEADLRSILIEFKHGARFLRTLESRWSAGTPLTQPAGSSLAANPPTPIPRYADDSGGYPWLLTSYCSSSCCCFPHSSPARKPPSSHSTAFD
jgi:hypothetical protein